VDRNDSADYPDFRRTRAGRKGRERLTWRCRVLTIIEQWIRTERAMEIATAALTAGLSVELISNVTKLRRDTVLRLKKGEDGWSEPCPVEFVAKMVELLKGTELEKQMRDAATAEVVDAALEEGVCVDTVAKITGLAQENVLRLQSEMVPSGDHDVAWPAEAEARR